MKDKIKIFLESDLLEKYLLGTSSREENSQVERYIVMYPEVRKNYEELQENLEIFARLHSLRSPEGLKAKILHQIKSQNIGRRKFRRYAIAASITAFIFAGSSYFFWNQNKSLQNENTIVHNRILNLEADMKQQLEDVRNQFIVLNNPQTKKFYVNGNAKAKDLKAVAYVNPVKKLSFINVRSLPNLPKDKVYQMWAEVNGEMVNLGIIKKIEDRDRLMPLPYGKNAISYITIEPMGGNVSPTVQNIVANIKY
jgi:hypothetical protein